MVITIDSMLIKQLEKLLNVVISINTLLVLTLDKTFEEIILFWRIVSCLTDIATITTQKDMIQSEIVGRVYKGNWLIN